MQFKSEHADPTLEALFVKPSGSTVINHCTSQILLQGGFLRRETGVYTAVGCKPASYQSMNYPPLDTRAEAERARMYCALLHELRLASLQAVWQLAVLIIHKASF